MRRWANGSRYGPGNIFFYTEGDRYLGQWEKNTQQGINKCSMGQISGTVGRVTHKQGIKKCSVGTNILDSGKNNTQQGINKCSVGQISGTVGE